ncbi:3-hydroxyacyl-CoA dehydrogenase NAD-binding domain-containing protein [Acidimangrovimonas sediminis]|uniref:3-hydroxyacyl-CoA dehydrogenase NAD-binding domain-containing protein n=1 Tax=Acidimangrovimonas sediminis TaxID=2056283 RepID=UPI0018EC8DF4
MGVGLARHFDRGGFDVAIVDPSATSRDRARAGLAETRGSGAPDNGAPDSGAGGAFACAAQVGDLDDAWRDCVLAIEAVPEKLSLKRQAIAALEDWLPAGTVIASNTSGLTTVQLTEAMRVPGRLAITHFFNPADVIPVVEVVPGPEMQPAPLAALVETLRASGKLPAVLRKEVPGFVANRIQHAMMREAFHLLEEGVADAETLDEIVRWTIGVRLAFFGPFLQRDLNGLDTHLSIAEYLYGDLSAATEPSAPLREKVAAGRTGRKAGAGFYDWDTGREDAQADAERALSALITDMTLREGLRHDPSRPPEEDN